MLEIYKVMYDRIITQGKPEMMACGGKFLNELTKSNDYAADKVYHVTPKGITEVSFAEFGGLEIDSITIDELN